MLAEEINAESGRVDKKRKKECTQCKLLQE
jgi:hypothetical protein